jgi:hypothetical protein
LTSRVTATCKPQRRCVLGSAQGVPAHNVWGWALSPLPGGGSRVTEFFDCSASPEWLREATNEGENWWATIKASLANLARVFAGSTA